jgi:hypothetical protein
MPSVSDQMIHPTIEGEFFTVLHDVGVEICFIAILLPYMGTSR